MNGQAARHNLGNGSQFGSDPGSAAECPPAGRHSGGGSFTGWAASAGFASRPHSPHSTPAASYTAVEHGRPGLDRTIPYADIVRKLLRTGEVESARRLIRIALQDRMVDPECRRLARFLEPPRVSARPRAGSGGDSEFDWIADHCDRYRGQWVAVLGHQLLANATSLNELLERVRRLSPERPPLVHQIPASAESC